MIKYDFLPAGMQIHELLYSTRRDFLRQVANASWEDGKQEFFRAWEIAARGIETQDPGDHLLYFPETGHHLAGLFLTYYRIHRNGFLLGLPITEELTDGDGQSFQLFENALLVQHKDTGMIQPAGLGETCMPRWLWNDSSPPFNHQWYEKYGGEAFFGSPISAPIRRDNITLQYTQNFLLVSYNKFTVAPQFFQSYRIYKDNKVHFPGLFWPGETVAYPLGRILAEREGYPLERVEPQDQTVLRTPNLWNNDKKIEVNINSQTLTAWEKDVAIMTTHVSTGVPGFDTPFGIFRIEQKIPVMRYRSPFPELRNYDLPAVPFNLQIYGNVLLHAAYWHDRFGTRQSSGCVNLNIDDAHFLYDWASVGTPVTVGK